MSDQLNHMSGQFCSCSDILSEHFLLLIGNPVSDVQIVVVVRQRRSKTLEEAVATVLETESYVAQGKSETKNLVVEAVDKPDEKCEVGTVRVQPDVIPLLESIVKRLVKLQSKRDSFAIRPQQEWKMKGEQKTRGPVICFRCGQEGHVARGCASGPKEAGKLMALSTKDQLQEGIVKVHSTDVFSLAVYPTASYFVTVSVDDIALQLMVDTGAAVSLLRKDQWVRLVGPNGEDGTMKWWETCRSQWMPC